MKQSLLYIAAFVLLGGCNSASKPEISEAEQSAAAYAVQGTAQAKAGRLTEAVVEFNRGIAIDPANVEPYIGLAVLYESVNRPDLAVETLEQLRAANPEAKGLACRLAEAYLGAEDLNNAKTWGEKAVKEGTDAVRAHSVYGITMLRFRYWDTALEQLQKAWSLAPDDLDLPLLLMDVFTQKGDYLKATELGEQIAAKADQSPPFHYKLGWGYARQPQRAEVTQRAETHLKRAIELAPKWFEPCAELGRLYKSLGRNEDALRYFERAWEMNGQVAGVAFNLIALWKQKGDKRSVEAEALYKRKMQEQERFTALRRDYNNPLIQSHEKTVVELAGREGRSKMYGTALHRLRKLLSEKPQNREALILYVRLDQETRLQYDNYLRPGPGISVPGL
jgi:Tfp pilus assembly protein PilF